ncbi:sensor histidine kinase [[Clostridium] fimetarium]|uniref:Histidine kinase-, DNA gyrase B-, and HSP90-like ATPase n=1 Tax=[Clostridium] fimetarium TaxID=99656 RepID=A0A1I0RLD9_9FIRM|nr:Spo0B domain-containing protein [[Clostridium] fimetarium]SEW41856.1 Histidine kinase-, DNA gyrase B-, and HSP90-like ATPase [[Clostridium] fimetarium]
MYVRKVVRNLLIICYIQFFLCILFWIGVGTKVLGRVGWCDYAIMGAVLFCSGGLIIGIGLINRYYNVGIEETIKNLEELNTTLRTQRHDYINHMQIVYGLLELDEYQDAREYLEPVFVDIMKVSNALKTSKPALNALLQAKMETARRADIAMFLGVTSDLRNIKIEQWELCKVLANLIDNAITAVDQMEKEKTIHIEIGEDIRNYRFCVYNNGPVIPESQQDLIFKKGYSTKKDEGHGLGLMIINQILDSNNGTIELQSIEGKTSFTVFISKEDVS